MRSSHSLGAGPLNPRNWSLAVRVVSVTILLSTLAVLVVGAYLSSVISDGLFEQRRDRALEESGGIRSELVRSLQDLSGSTDTQRQDAATGFVLSVRSSDGPAERDAALVPVDTAGAVSVISSDRTMMNHVDDAFADTVAQSPGTLSWRSIGFTGKDDREHPGLLVGTRVVVPGSGSYDLFILYSLQQEQETLSFVQKVMAGGGAVLLALVVGIAVVVARLVTTPLHRAALAAERIAQGDLSSRVRVSGADELARVGESFNLMAGNLEEKVSDLTELSRLQQRFVSDVSHELRTPLTTIRMATSVLDGHRDSFDPDLARTTELLSTQVRRFESLLAELLEISRFDAGAAVLEAREDPLNDIVRSSIDDLRVLAGTRGSLLDLRLTEADTTVHADPRRIDRILRNLLTNALEHGGGHPLVIETGADADAVAVLVQDHGVGLSPQEAGEVFGRFWRGDPSRARTLGGTGLGLSIALEDARLHGGWLQAWGLRGQGAVFRLTLPRRPGEELQDSPLQLERPFAEPIGPAEPSGVEPVPPRPEDAAPSPSPQERS